MPTNKDSPPYPRESYRSMQDSHDISPTVRCILRLIKESGLRQADADNLQRRRQIGISCVVEDKVGASRKASPGCQPKQGNNRFEPKHGIPRTKTLSLTLHVSIVSKPIRCDSKSLAHPRSLAVIMETFGYRFTTSGSNPFFPPQTLSPQKT